MNTQNSAAVEANFFNHDLITVLEIQHTAGADARFLRVACREPSEEEIAAVTEVEYIGKAWDCSEGRSTGFGIFRTD